MASLIPGYEYDIFISYCQKYNKGNFWKNDSYGVVSKMAVAGQK